MNGKKNDFSHQGRKKDVKRTKDSVHNSKKASHSKGKRTVSVGKETIMADKVIEDLSNSVVLQQNTLSEPEVANQAKPATKPEASDKVKSKLVPEVPEQEKSAGKQEATDNVSPEPDGKSAPELRADSKSETAMDSNQIYEDESHADSPIKAEIEDKPVSIKKTEKAAEGSNMSGKKIKKKKNVAFYLLAASAALLLLAYLGTALFFQSHFLPNTTINELDCSYLTSAETAELLYIESLAYCLTVIGRDAEIGVINADEIDMTIIDALESVNGLLEQQSALGWVTAFRKHQNFNLIYGIDFDKQKVEELMDEWEALSVAKARPPKNAYIGEYDEQLKGYEIVPDVEGTLLDRDEVRENVMAALQMQEDTLDLEAANCYISAEITADNAKLLQKLDKLNTWTGTCITYDWNGEKVVLDGDTIHEWILDEGNSLSLDEEAAAQFVADHAKENDTYGKKRKFTTTLGIELTLPSGAYGWKTNRAAETEALIELIKKGEVCDREPEYSSKGYQKGKNDIGSTYVECDLSNQHLYLYQEGELILETDFVSGNMSISNNVTPPGVFGLTYKTRNAVLRGEDYETPVKYWMPFNGNVGMHDANWRSSFGGDIFLTGGSHGCINLPPAKAAQIYEYMTTGFPVICYYY